LRKQLKTLRLASMNPEPRVTGVRALFRRAVNPIIQSCVLLGLFSAVNAIQAASTALQATGANYVAFEAENGTLIAGTPETWAVKANTTASGQKTLRSDGNNDVNTAPHSFAQYKIKFATAGTYFIYIHWMADPALSVGDNFTANSIWIANRFGAFSTAGAAAQPDYIRSAANDVNYPNNDHFIWTRETALSYEVTEADIAAGPVTLTIGTREAGFMLDRIILSTQDNLTAAQSDALVNSETDVVVQGATDTFVAFEAETKAKLFAGTPENWTLYPDNNASGKAALRSIGVNDTVTSPHSFAQYQIQFATEGTYSIYIRWLADPTLSVGDNFTANSIWIANRFGAFSTPGAAAQTDYIRSAANDVNYPNNDHYIWTRETAVTYTVTAAEISGGPVTLTIGTREAGFTLDRIVLSPQDTLTGAQLDALLNSGAQAIAPELNKAVGSAELNKISLVFSRPLDPATVAASDFAITPTLQVTSVEVDPADGRNVQLTTANQTQGVKYTVTVTGVSDTAGTPISTVNQKAFTAWKLVTGWATREIYQNMTGTTLDSFTSDPAYIARTPNRVDFVRGFAIDNEPHTANYGARLMAFFTPAANGIYDFYPINDDQADILISSDKTEANLQSLTAGVGFSLQATYDENIFAESPDLAAGTPYLLVGLLKQNTGDVYLKTAVRPQGDTTPLSSALELGGSRIATFVNPDLGVVTFSEQPANATASVGSRATFRVRVTSPGSPIYYQWQEDGFNIPGAIRNTYITPPLTSDKNGKAYRCVVSVAGIDTTSNAATLTVTPGAPPAEQPFIGVNFVGGGDQGGLQLIAQDVAGVVRQNNWNNLTGSTFDGVTLNDAAGAVSPVTLTTSGTTEQWYTGAGDVGSADGRLFQGFIGAGAAAAGTPVSFTLNNVPAGTYSVIAYTMGFNFQNDYRESFSLIGATEPPPLHVKGETGLAFNSNPAFRRMSSVDAANPTTGNYVQFDNVSPDANGAITLNVAWESDQLGNSHQPAINGIQLVKVTPVTTRPTIGLSRNGNSVTLSWTADATGFHFVTTAALTATSPQTTVPGTPNPITGAGSVSIIIPTTGNGFYWLVK
jgi:hypothetical protein